MKRHTIRPSAVVPALFALFVVVGLWLGFTVSAHALEPDDTPRYWDQERQRQEANRPRAAAERPTRLLRRQAPQRAYVPQSLPDPAPTVGDGPSGGSVETNAAPDPTLPTYTVMVLGDSMAQMLSQGLQEAFADSKNVVILAKARENTGLVRDDYFDWVKGARDLAASASRIDLAVIMVGSNDNQAIRDGQTSLEPLSARWKEIYGQRIAAIDQAFRERNIPLVWVGAPIVRSDRLATVLLQANDMARTQAAAHQLAYVDTWDAFADEHGQFSAYGPDLNGQTNKIRSADGVHFTKAGARKLAHFVETDLRRTIEAIRPAVLSAPDPAAPAGTSSLEAAPPLESARLETPAASVGATVGTGIGLPPPDAPLPSPLGKPAAAQPKSLQVALPAPNAPLRPVIAVKPAAGPVVALTAPVVSPNGQLAVPAGPAVQATKVLVEGRPVDPLPDRADDFAWPKSR